MPRSGMSLLIQHSRYARIGGVQLQGCIFFGLPRLCDIVLDVLRIKFSFVTFAVTAFHNAVPYTYSPKHHSKQFIGKILHHSSVQFHEKEAACE